MNRYKKSGWYNESHRHRLARQGIKTKVDYSKSKDYISGGLADNIPASFFNKKQLARGIKVELEHTDNPKIAREIAKDHLKENPMYYEYLEEMEKKLDKAIDYQQDVLYEPTTVEFPQNPIEIDITNTEKRRRFEEKLTRAGQKTRQAVSSTGRAVVGATEKVAKGVLGTIAEGLSYDPLEDEPNIPVGYMGMGRKKDVDFSKPPKGFVFVDWKDSSGKTWKDTIPRDSFSSFQLRVIGSGGQIKKIKGE